MANPIFSGVSEYVMTNTELLNGEIVLRIPHIKDFSLQPNCRGTQVQLNLLNAEPLLEDGTTCVTSGGTSTITNRMMDLAYFQINTPYCAKQLLPYWAGLKVKLGSADMGELSAAFVDGEITKVNKDMEKIIWQGVKATDRLDGIATIAASDANEVTTSSGDTLYTRVNQVRLAAQGSGVTDIVIAIGADKYFALVDELVAKNLYHYTATADGEMEFVFPGSNVKVWGVRGLNGSDVAIAFEPANIVYGYNDTPDEVENVRWAIDEVNDMAHLKADWVSGVQIAHPDRVYFGTIAE